VRVWASVCMGLFGVWSCAVAPKLSRPPLSERVTEGQSVEFDCRVIGTPYPVTRVSWTKAEQPLHVSFVTILYMLLCHLPLARLFGSTVEVFFVAAATIWNSLANDVRNNCLIASFRRRFETFLQPLAISSASPNFSASDSASFSPTSFCAIKFTYFLTYLLIVIGYRRLSCSGW